MSRRIVSAALLLAVVTSCGAETPDVDAPPVAPSAPVADLPLEQVTRDGATLVAVVPDPWPIPFNEPFTVDIDLFDASQPTRRLDDATAVIDAWMPDHGHGMNVFPKVEPRDGGGLRAHGMLFHMRGRWELQVDVVHEGLSSRATFEVTL